MNVTSALRCDEKDVMTAPQDVPRRMWWLPRKHAAPQTLVKSTNALSEGTWGLPGRGHLADHCIGVLCLLRHVAPQILV